MTKRVKRGLGLIVVAFIAWLFSQWAVDAWRDGAPTAAISSVALLVAGVLGATGLVVVAVGLLRD